MTEQTEWWKGLGEELETDIEALTDKLKTLKIILKKYLMICMKPRARFDLAA